MQQKESIGSRLADKQTRAGANQPQPEKRKRTNSYVFPPKRHRSTLKTTPSLFVIFTIVADTASSHYDTATPMYLLPERNTGRKPRLSPGLQVSPETTLSRLPAC